MKKEHLSKANIETLKNTFYHYLASTLKMNFYSDDNFSYIYDENFHNILDLSILDYNKNIKYLDTIDLERSERHKPDLYIQIVFRRRLEKSNHLLEKLRDKSYFIKRNRKDKMKKMSFINFFK